MRGHFGYGIGNTDTGVDLEMQLIKTSLPMAYNLHPPNPAKGTLPLARSPFAVALLYRQTQSDIYWDCNASLHAWCQLCW